MNGGGGDAERRLSLIHICIASLVIASLLLMVGSFLVLAEFGGSPPGSTYVPAHIEGGKFCLLYTSRCV